MPLLRQLQQNRRQEVTVLFANGTATAILSVPVGPSWQVKQITIHTSFTNPIVQCTTFIGTSTAGQRISHALYGNDDTDSLPNTTIRYGESLCAIWTGGTNGQTATMTVIFDEVDY